VLSPLHSSTHQTPFLVHLPIDNYHRAFIEEYIQMAFPLQALTGKRTYQWGDEQEKAFDELRNAMATQQVMPKLSREPNYC
jgi:hypothetical protein